MTEIKKSKKGIDYAEPYVLKSKKRSFTRAILMKIPHNHSDTSDIWLKIGRYNSSSNKPDNDKPKSELTLDNDELHALIKYISEKYAPVDLGSGKYINVDGSNVALIEEFKKLVEGQEDTANLLIKNGILSDKVFIDVILTKKRDALSEFEKKLSENLLETNWQKWFTDNKWVLGSDFTQIIPERKIDTNNIADYIMRSFDGFIDLVEIKKPNGLKFWASTTDHDNYVPSSDLTKAITQCLNYIYAIELEANSQKFIESTKSKVIKPRCILVFGRSNKWNDKQRESYRILNSAYNQLTILTYDHLLSRAKNVLGIIDADDDDSNDFHFNKPFT